MVHSEQNFSTPAHITGSQVRISDVSLDEEEREAYHVWPAITRATGVSLVLVLVVSLATWIFLGTPSIDRESSISVNESFGLIAFAFALVGGLSAVAALVLSYRRQVANETTNELTMLANELSRSEMTERLASEEARQRDAAERMVTDLFITASHSLGSERAPERLAGLYALERLGDNTPDCRQMIVNLLCAYLRGAQDDSTSEEEGQVRSVAQGILTSRLSSAKGEPRTMMGTTQRGAWSGLHLDLTGARLTNFDFDYGEVASADFRRTVFTGSTSMVNANFAGEANFSGTVFEGDVSFGRAEFGGRVSFAAARVNGHANFNGATFASDADFRRATFDHSISLSNATFHRTALFDSAIVRGDAVLNKAVYQGDSSFNRTHFVGHVWFTGAQFRAVARFPEARFDGDAAFGGAVLFKERAQFDKAFFTRRAMFNDSRFEKEISFRGAVFGNSADFREARFKEDARFENASFGNEALFEGAQISGDAAFARVRLSPLSASDKSSWPEGWQVDRSNAGSEGPTLRYSSPVETSSGSSSSSSPVPETAQRK